MVLNKYKNVQTVFFYYHYGIKKPSETENLKLADEIRCYKWEDLWLIVWYIWEACAAGALVVVPGWGYSSVF